MESNAVFFHGQRAPTLRGAAPEPTPEGPARPRCQPGGSAVQRRANGKRRDLVTARGKDGLLRVLDRAIYELLNEIPITSRTNGSAAPTVEGLHACPGMLGGMEWNGPAYNLDPRS